MKFKRFRKWLVMQQLCLDDILVSRIVGNATWQNSDIVAYKADRKVDNYGYLLSEDDREMSQRDYPCLGSIPRIETI